MGETGESFITIVILAGKRQAIGREVELVEIRLPTGTADIWPEDVSSLFRQIESEHPGYQKFIEEDPDKEPIDCFVIYHKNGKKLGPGNFLSSDIIKGDSGKRINKLGIIVSSAVVAGGLTAYLVLRAKKKTDR